MIAVTRRRRQAIIGISQRQGLQCPATTECNELKIAKQQKISTSPDCPL
jgi:hypothetical protein